MADPPLLDPTMHVVLTKDGRTSRFEIHTSSRFDAWGWITEEAIGVVHTPERVLALRAEFHERIAALKGAGWVEQ